MERYVGRAVDIIYHSHSGQFTKRRIKVCAVNDGKVLAYCYQRKAPRMFEVDRILAVIPASWYDGRKELMS